MDLNIDLFEEVLLEIVKKQREELGLIEQTTKLIEHYKRIYKVYKGRHEIKIYLSYENQREKEEMLDTGMDYIALYLDDLYLLIRKNFEELQQRGFNIDFEEQGEQQ